MITSIPVYQRTVYYSLGMQLYMTETIKKPLMKAIAVLFDSEASKMGRLKALKIIWDVLQCMKGLPEPTKENTWHPNTHNLIDLRDWLFGCCKLNDLRMTFVRRVINFVIILYDFDPPWRWIFDSLREEAMRKDWKPRGFNDTWKDTYKWWEDADLHVHV